MVQVLWKQHARDIMMVDVIWNGFVQAKKVADLANVYQMSVCPHNYYSHLATFISASLCGVVSNVRSMEIDMDDVPWKGEFVSKEPEIVKVEPKK